MLASSTAQQIPHDTAHNSHHRQSITSYFSGTYAYSSRRSGRRPLSALYAINRYHMRELARIFHSSNYLMWIIDDLGLLQR